MGLGLLRRLAGRSIMLLVSLALVALTVITLGGMSASVVFVESTSGGASAINVAGSLRRLAHRATNLAAVDAMSGRGMSARVVGAMADFEQQLKHPALQRVLEREPGELFAATFRGIEATWQRSIRPRIEAFGNRGEVPPGEQVDALLGEVDTFVEQLNTLVAVLEQNTEQRIQDLRQMLAIAIFATILGVIAVLILLHRALMRPLAGLLEAAGQIARGDFAARVSHAGDDELGRVGGAFNKMADELAKLYRSLEQRVADKTTELQRSNRALELLYHATARLYQAPTAADVYEATLRDIDRVAGLEGSFVCIEPSGAKGPANVIASSLGPCPERGASGPGACAACRAAAGEHDAGPDTGELLRFPLRDRQHHYGMLRLALPPGASLEVWQRQLVEALSRHIGMALGAARRSEQERLLALQEERSVIARELHDSLAQALSYMKIQVSLLQRRLADPAQAGEAATMLADLREGLNAAYRQLRELLVSFRLGLSGDLATLLQDAAREYGTRGDVEVGLEVDLGQCLLTPNQEVHVLQIVREALSNMVRHAGARHARVALVGNAAGEVELSIEDDGVGFGAPPSDAHNHHGLSIMQERTLSMGGEIQFEPRTPQGTCVRVRFRAATPLALAKPVAADKQRLSA